MHHLPASSPDAVRSGAPRKGAPAGGAQQGHDHAPEPLGHRVQLGRHPGDPEVSAAHAAADEHLPDPQLGAGVHDPPCLSQCQGTIFTRAVH